jgi:hypothetical protein
LWTVTIQQKNITFTNDMMLFTEADVLNIELTVIKKLISKLKTIKDIKNFNSYWLWSTENVKN